MFDKTIILIAVVGIILRVVLSFSTYHPDIQAFDFGGQLVSKGHILNLYDYLPNLSKDAEIRKFYPTYFFNYPPAIYLYHGLFALLFNNFLSPGLLLNSLINVPRVLPLLDFKVHLLFLKIPYLLPDLLIARILYGQFRTRREKLLALSFWLFNPINLFATYMMGQFDIIPTFFIVSSIYLANLNKNIKHIYFSSLVLGVGSAFKIYPLLLVIPLASCVKNIYQRIFIVALGLAPYILSLTPYLSSKNFRSSALVAGQSLKSFYPQIAVSGGESIMLFLASLIFCYLYFLYHPLGKIEFIWKRYFIILMIFFIFTHYHPQWFLWLTPFFIIDVLKTNYSNLILVILSFLSFFGLLLFFDSSLSVGLFAPVWKDLYHASSIWEIFKLNPDVNFLRSILHTIFVGAAVFYIYQLCKEEKSAA